MVLDRRHATMDCQQHGRTRQIGTRPCVHGPRRRGTGHWPAGTALAFTVTIGVCLVACGKTQPAAATAEEADAAEWVEHALGPVAAISGNHPVVLRAPRRLRSVPSGTFPEVPPLRLALEGPEMRLQVSMARAGELPRPSDDLSEWHRESVTTVSPKGWLAWRRERAQIPAREGWHIVGFIELADDYGVALQGWADDTALPSVRRIAQSIHIRR
jgi:hypothetical protein